MRIRSHRLGQLGDASQTELLRRARGVCGDPNDPASDIDPIGAAPGRRRYGVTCQVGPAPTGDAWIVDECLEFFAGLAGVVQVLPGGVGQEFQIADRLGDVPRLEQRRRDDDRRPKGKDGENEDAEPNQSRILHWAALTAVQASP